MKGQLALGLTLRDSARFSNFIGAANIELVTQLQHCAAAPAGKQLLCWGAPGSGKTHLLQACCHSASEAGHAVVYLSLGEASRLSPVVLEGWEGYALVCLDDIDAIAGLADWEAAVFHLYNRLRDGQGGLLISARAAPAAWSFTLPDMASRLVASVIYQLQPLDDAHSLQALQLRASLRGFDLPEETGRYLIRRLPRDLPALMALLDRLDSASLAAQRRLTVPFVRSVLDL
jgi:DnaA family protein